MNDSRGAPVSRGVDRRTFLRAVGGAAVLSLAGCGREKQRFAPAQGVTSSERAVHAARQFAGTSLNVGWETGPQAQGFTRFAVPLWEELTGIRINIVEMGAPLDQFRRLAAEHRAGTGALDCASVVPAWMPDLVAEGALEPLDEYVAHYQVATALADYLPLYRTLGVLDGRRYGFFDDGDALLLYYRRDLFEDAAKQKAFMARHGRPLGDPRAYDWREFIDVARFFTESYAPDLYGLAPLTRELCWACFGYLLRIEGGEFFNPQSMKPMVNSSIGVRAMTNVMEMMRVMVPMGTMEPHLSASLSAYLSGKAAMAIFWPPLGRLAEQIGHPIEALGSLPQSQIREKTGYALLPGGASKMTVGFVLSVLANSGKKEAAYLFIQWLSSPEISLQRVSRLDTLRDPYRYSHIQSPEFRSRWPAAGDYLDTLEKAANGYTFVDLMIPGAHAYQEAFYEVLTNMRLGTPVEPALQQLAISWERITENLGRARQRRAYADYLKRPGATITRRAPANAGTKPR